MAKAYSLLLFCVLVWGSNFVIGKILLIHFSPAFITAVRFAFIVLALFGYGNIKRIAFITRFSKKDVILLIFLGIVGVFINQWTFFIGLETAEPTSAALIIAMTPLVTCLLAAIILKEIFSRRMAFGLLLAISGALIVVLKDSEESVQIDSGLWWIVVTMVTFALMIIITRLMSQRIHPFLTTFYSNVIAFIISIPVAFMEKETKFVTDKEPWLLLIVSAIVVHGMCNLIWNNRIREVNASNASMLTNLEPFVAMVLGLILLNKPILWTQVLGATLIVLGVLLANKKKNKKYTNFQKDEKDFTKVL